GVVWEITGQAVGTSRARVVAGDPAAFDSVYRFSVEGVLAVDARPVSAARFVDRTATVDGRHGRLTIANVAGAVNNKLAFVEITSITTSGTGTGLRGVYFGTPAFAG